MSRISFVSHEAFVDDEYTKELVYLCIDKCFRVAYIRKKASNGGMFWSVVSAGVTKCGKKEYFPAFVQDSNFLEQDIKAFLDARSWEKTTLAKSASTFAPAPTSMSEVDTQLDLPF